MYHIQTNINNKSVRAFIFFAEKTVYKIPENYEYSPETFIEDINKQNLQVDFIETGIDKKLMPVPFYIHNIFIDDNTVYHPLDAKLDPLDCQYEYRTITYGKNESCNILSSLYDIVFDVPADCKTFDSSYLKIDTPTKIYYKGKKCFIRSSIRNDVDFCKEVYAFYKGKIVNYLPIKPIANEHGQLAHILHLPGESNYVHQYWTHVIADNYNVTLPDDITIITFATNERESLLIQQLKRNNIPYINAVKDCITWDNTQKIKYLQDALQQVKTQFVLLMDGYDVVIQSFDNIIDIFKETGYKILFNATANNFPKVDIDRVPEREKLGYYKYLNAGCCIGYTESIIKFYKEVELVRNSKIDNPNNSEQLLVRKAFSRYSLDKNQKYIAIDSTNKIFQVWCTKFIAVDAGECYTIVENKKPH